MMEVNNLGLQTNLKPVVRSEFETRLDNLQAAAHDMREGLLSVGLTSLGCTAQACNLTNLGSDMPDICILELLDWIEEVAHSEGETKNIITRARQLNGYVQMIVNKVEPIATTPDGRHELSFLMRSLAHPRVQACLEDLHRQLGKVASYLVESSERKAA